MFADSIQIHAKAISKCIERLCPALYKELHFLDGDLVVFIVSLFCFAIYARCIIILATYAPHLRSRLYLLYIQTHVYDNALFYIVCA